MKRTNTLEELSNLKENWNGYNAPPIDKRSIENASKILLKHPDLFVFPMNDGYIQLEGTIPLEFEIEVYPERYVYTIWIEDELIYEKTFPIEKYNEII